MNNIQQQIFLIPLSQLNQDIRDFTHILYAPLQDVIALLNAEESTQMQSFLDNTTMPTDSELRTLVENIEVVDVMALKKHKHPSIMNTTRMSLLPNLKCNFACSYCYSAEGRDKTVLSWDKAKIALDYFISSDRIPPQHLSLFISGGGEPLLTWDLTKQCITYAHERAQKEGFTIHISIVTNGSLLDNEKITFLREKQCSICISFEVLKELQESQRKNYNLVDEHILLLQNSGVRTMLNSTITPMSVSLMPQMMQRVIERYPFIAQYTMEPVTSVDLFANATELRTFYDSFFQNYQLCKQIAREANINLRFTFDDALSDITIRHCPGKFAITPQGTISVCHLVSSPKEERYTDCIYGEITDQGTVVINQQKFDELYARNVFAYADCAQCFAKFICGGECLTRRSTYPKDFMEEVCRFNRKCILQLLRDNIAFDI